MVRLDHRLIFAVRRFINEANNHGLDEMILAYERAVDLHNKRSDERDVYQIGPELALRNYVMEQNDRSIQRRTHEAKELARRAGERLKK
jgi:hypothetical protein